MERAVVREVRGLRGTGSRYGEEERGGGDRRLCRGRNSLNRRRRRRWYREAWRVGVPPGGARGGSRDPTRLVREGGVGASWVSAPPRRFSSLLVRSCGWREQRRVGWRGVRSPWQHDSAWVGRRGGRRICGCGNARVKAVCRATLSAPSLMRCPPPPGSLCQGSSRRAPSGRASPWRLATCPAHARFRRAVGTWVHGWLWRGICCGHCECCKVALHHRRHSPGVSLGPRRTTIGPASRASAAAAAAYCGVRGCADPS